MHRSQNRIESYHQLRSAIAQVGGKKELTGRTDLEKVLEHERLKGAHEKLKANSHKPAWQVLNRHPY